MSEPHYRSILKSTSVIGGSSLINILISMVRTKFVAVLLGPAGVGLMGMYGTITGMIGAVSSMGLGTSGVRQIAESHGTGDERRVALTVKTLRQTVWLTGTLGMLAAIGGCMWWSKITFGSSEHAIGIALLGMTILMGSVSMGQSCLLQGTRRITDLARINIVSAAAGTLISIPCFYLWGMDGIVPSLLLCSAAGLATSWWFARRVSIKLTHPAWSESRAEAARLLTIGLPLMLSGLGGALTTYVIRLILIRKAGLAGVGIYQAAFALSGVIVNFVLTAMGTDYYPRLTAVVSNSQQVTYEVNAQTEIGLLLGVPGLAATFILAPVVIPLFYSGRFDAAISILRWTVFGLFGRIVSWPLGYVILAKGRSTITLWAEALNDSLWIVLTLVCVNRWGLDGAGIAFALLYIFATSLFLKITNTIAGTTWSRSTVLHIIGMGAVLTGLALNCHVVPAVVRWILNLMLFGSLSAYCLRRLSRISGITAGTALQNLLPPRGGKQ